LILTSAVDRRGQYQQLRHVWSSKKACRHTIGQNGRVSLLMKSVVPVWLVAVLGAIAVAVLADPENYLVFLPVVLGVTTLLTFGIQLGIRRKEGYVNRVTASVTGAVVVLAIATIVLAPLAFAA
jgi:hypothetical protein